MPPDLRPVVMERGYLPFAEGSCIIQMGRTRVLCAATLEERVPAWLRGGARGWVTAEYSMLPRSTAQRTPREVQSGRPSGRTQEIQRLIGRSLRSVTDLASLGERTITVDCDVLIADGGTRTASITGAYVALADAIATLADAGTVPKGVLTDHVAAVSVGIVSGVPVLDLDYEEDVAASVDMNLVMTGAGAFVEVQGTAEGDPFDRDELGELIDLGTYGIETLIQEQRAVLQA
ncbi:MAG: ribonuclease PH [Actinomycetota bacterium]